MIITSPHFLIIIFIISPQYVEFMVQTCFLSIPTTTLFSFVSCQCAPLGFRRAARLPFQLSTSTSIPSSRIIVHEEIIPVDLEPADRAEQTRWDRFTVRQATHLTRMWEPHLTHHHIPVLPTDRLSACPGSLGKMNMNSPPRWRVKFITWRTNRRCYPLWIGNQPTSWFHFSPLTAHVGFTI